MRWTTYIRQRPLALFALLAITLNAVFSVFCVFWGIVAPTEGVTIWAWLAALALISMPALANLVLGLLMRPQSQPLRFFAPASVSSFLSLGLFYLAMTDHDAQASIGIAIAWFLQLLVLPVFWALAFALCHHGE